ncbi:histidine phosphatase superfamily [Chytridium lagenaria]|nr:histidine phosphatase superfamily [Chytridium lagenaria]
MKRDLPKHGLDFEKVTDIPSWHKDDIKSTANYWTGNCNIGQLSARGLEQIEALGSQFRAFYLDQPVWDVDDVTKLTNSKFIILRSTDVERTIQSAQAFTTGLLSSDLLESFQSKPVRILVRPRPIDPLSVGIDPNCPRLHYLHNIVRRGKVSKETFEALKHISGATFPTFKGISYFMQCGKGFDATSRNLSAQLTSRVYEEDGSHSSVPGHASYGKGGIYVGIETWLDVLRCRTCHEKKLPCAKQRSTSDNDKCIDEVSARDVFKIAGWWIRHEFNVGHRIPRPLVPKNPMHEEDAFVTYLQRQEARLRVGPLLHDLLGEMLEAALDVKLSSLLRLDAASMHREYIHALDGRKNDRDVKRVFLYSAHDMTLAGLLGVLDVDDRRWPPYASNMIFEVWRIPAREEERERVLVRLVYNGRTVPLPWCRSKMADIAEEEWVCELVDVIAGLRDVLPVDLREECKLPQDVGAETFHF